MNIASATYIEVAADVRYWEDAVVNGVKDADGSLIPGKDGETWKAVIRLSDGLIEGWPAGTTALIHYKVCDAGEYWLQDDAGNRVAKWKGYYVPNEYLCQGDNGFGDYIIMNVGPDGIIENYTPPAVDELEWAPL